MSKEIKLKPEAVALLQRVKQHILEEPRRMDMLRWVENRPEHLKCAAEIGNIAGVPPCGTVACIAGWVVQLGSVRPSQVKVVARRARQLLGLPIPRSIGKIEQFGLFHLRFWPIELERKVRGFQPGTPEYAQVVAEAIDRFIASPEEFR